MNLLSRLVLSAAAFVAAHSASVAQVAEYDRATIRKGDDFAAYLGELESSFVGARQFEVFEGLPHPSEKELLQRERETKKVVVLHGGEFYAGPGRPAAAQAAQVSALMAGTLSEYGGHKLCGGFHADYAVRWFDASNRIWTALFCYGCGEAAIFGPAGSLKCDLNGPEGKAWREWLAQFDGQRPRRESK